MQKNKRDNTYVAPRILTTGDMYDIAHIDESIERTNQYNQETKQRRGYQRQAVEKSESDRELHLWLMANDKAYRDKHLFSVGPTQSTPPSNQGTISSRSWVPPNNILRYSMPSDGHSADQIVENQMSFIGAATPAVSAVKSMPRAVHAGSKVVKGAEKADKVAKRWLTAQEGGDVISRGKELYGEYINNPTVRNTYNYNLAVKNRVKLNGYDAQDDIIRKGYRQKAYSDPIDIIFGANATSDPMNAAEYHWRVGGGPGIPGSEKIVLNNTYQQYHDLNNLSNIIKHEFMHRGGVGDGRFFKFKTEKLLRDDYMNILSSRYSGKVGVDYFDGFKNELIPNLLEVGGSMGVDLGATYPGVKGVKDFITAANKRFPGKRFVFDVIKLETPRDHKRLWDALSGKWVTTTAAPLLLAPLVNTEE
jgi:hypothetical protein